jgi:oxygen-independent coproporphyrinogen III oxidase
MIPPGSTLGIYVHLPFCRVRCSYCAFAISTDRTQEGAYVGALRREIADRKVDGAVVDTLYFGGGTPSKIDPRHLTALVEDLRASYTFDDGCEITLEANPEDVDDDSIRLWRSAGITRLSLGVQSFNDDELFPLGRGHGSSRALEALDRVVAAGFRTNADLIIGLPRQSRESFARSLGTAIDHGAGHLSLYMLDLEEGSNLTRRVRQGWVKLPDDEVTRELYLLAVATAGARGLSHYEISNFAREGEESRHNLRYWNREPYLGLGLGAHSYSGSERWANAADLAGYIEAAGRGLTAVVFRESLSESELRHEELFLSLRQGEGIRYSRLEELCGEEGREWVRRGLEEGWLRRAGERVAFTPEGFVLSNEHISRLF